ncbi:uncharacterized protein LOC6566910 [Drosophila grimshawi]|uniref:GH13120 n=1 Tax=Drosophila grimshawi TaxID=7222 RepID=B4JQT8_DROGR|nr:uncharacterized protein LOC6566910 [Drosophila grimshawi]EDV99268.1 GH13120 [Drosophila grimshawi]
MSSRRISKGKVPRDVHLVMALRRELNRNSRQITQTFWQEFEQIRNQQRHQLVEERNNRESIAALIRDANQDAIQQAEALGRSISSHGINPVAPSPCMRREAPAIMPVEHKNDSTIHVQQVLPSSTSSTYVPRAPPSSRATIPGIPSIRTSPNLSKLQLSQKPRK